MHEWVIIVLIRKNKMNNNRLIPLNKKKNLQHPNHIKTIDLIFGYDLSFLQLIYIFK